MASGKLTFGQVETRIRRDLLNDFDSEAYRWGVHQVMAAMNIAVCDIVDRYNQWAGYDQETMKRIYPIRNAKIEQYCMQHAGEQEQVVETEAEFANQISFMRSEKVSIDDRYEEAIALLAAGRLLQLDDTDTENAAKAATFIQQGMEYAQR